METSTKSENHAHEDFSGFPEVKSTSYQSQMQQTNPTKLSGLYFLKIFYKIAPQTPNREFYRISYRAR